MKQRFRLQTDSALYRCLPLRRTCSGLELPVLYVSTYAVSWRAGNAHFLINV